MYQAASAPPPTMTAPTGTDEDPRVPASPGRRFLGALVGRDYAALDGLLADDVWLRALLPRHLEEHYGSGETAAAFRSWFERAGDLRTVARGHSVVAGKERITYRFLLRPYWEPEIDHLIEQVAFLSIKDGRIRKIDLVCTGFIPHDPTPGDTFGLVPQ
jgi:hypothetical protein